MKHPFMAVLGTASVIALSTVLGGCSGKSGPAEASSTAHEQQSDQNKMRLVGEFKFVRHVSLASPPASTSKLARQIELTTEGKFSQLVTVSDQPDGGLSLSEVDPASTHIDATATEKGQLDLNDPGGNTLVKEHEESSFSGPITEFPSISIKRSLLGAGDEVSIRLEAVLGGKASTVSTTSQGMVMKSDEATQASLLDPEAGQSDKRKFALDFNLLPSLGPRPEIDPHADPSDAEKTVHNLEIQSAQRMYDGIKALPSAFNLGLVTSPQRDHWDYSGEISKPGSGADGSQWTETLHVTLKLEKP
ncbi:hypothetical protein [Dyella choica]|uniref:Lipoprotein n=1 Tax=Dyella choica TaxID=1927959 RepID=A0A3S0RIJ0_9GAMM|nr:hypothetical protein [Dyella choica]RUL72185.1 hypothetical protein EKH80_17840 [Dyella choica]